MVFVRSSSIEDFRRFHKAWNVRLDADIHGQRSQNETVNSRIKRKYGEFVRSRRWWKQFRELVVGCLTTTSTRHSERSI